MRRDLILAFVIVVSVHVGVAVIPQFFKSGPQKVKHEEDTAIKIDLPPPPPVEPDEDEVKQLEDQSTTMAPPSLVDIPTMVPIDAISVKAEPPPPPSLKMGGTISVPVQHTSLQGAQIFNLADLDQQPEARFQPEPQYPFELKRTGVEGTVTVGFICDTQGNVVNANVISSSGSHELDEAAVQGVSKWKFRPGKRGGHAVNVRMEQPISFNITNP